MADNKKMFQVALRAGLVSSSTEFWTKVRRSGLTPGAWIAKSLPRPKPAVRMPFYASAAGCSFCGCRWGNHGTDCPEYS